eukprot:2541970-Rhodomonas_salina.1
MQSLAFMPGSMPLRHSAASATGVKSFSGMRAQPPVARSSLLGLNMGEKQTVVPPSDPLFNYVYCALRKGVWGWRLASYLPPFS